ncbi:BRCT domain-containing protein [Mycena galericulata]|nr:BRCT domain-containing protein [Mycena galericulata]
MRSRGRKGRRVSGRTEAEDEEEDEERSAKRRKIDAGNGRARDGKPIKLMHTQANLSDDVLKALAQLGAKVTNRATECTHLIVPGLVRTEKFLCALAGAPYILTTAWALDSAEAGKLLPEDDYLLTDAAGERKHNVKLDDTLKRAKALRGTLFKDKVFYITEKVKPSRAMIQNIIQANGGQAITNQRPSLRILETHPNRHVISSAEDSALWQQIATVYPVYTSELILMGALRQWVNYKDAAFKVKGSV